MHQINFVQQQYPRYRDCSVPNLEYSKSNKKTMKEIINSSKYDVTMLLFLPFALALFIPSLILCIPDIGRNQITRYLGQKSSRINLLMHIVTILLIPLGLWYFLGRTDITGFIFFKDTEFEMVLPTTIIPFIAAELAIVFKLLLKNYKYFWLNVFEWCVCTLVCIFTFKGRLLDRKEAWSRYDTSSYICTNDGEKMGPNSTSGIIFIKDYDHNGIRGIFEFTTAGQPPITADAYTKQLMYNTGMDCTAIKDLLA